jgi:hypothetical protein
MTDCIEQTRTANDIVLEARELIAAAESILILIDHAAWTIGETCANDRDDALKAFGLGIAIQGLPRSVKKNLLRRASCFPTSSSHHRGESRHDHET